MLDQKKHKLLKLFVKIALTLVALWIVFLKVDEKRLLNILLSSHPLWLFLAVLFFNASKIVSAIRLNYYFRSININLGELDNIILYYVGMFYNLFLPGGIGGDGYKIYLLHKQYQTKISPLINATLLDRLSGLAALAFLAALLLFFSSFAKLYKTANLLLITSMLAVLPLFLLVHKRFFSLFEGVLKHTMLLAFAVQLLQLICAIFIALSIGAHSNMTDYLVIFLLSSIVAVLPISIGGIGARELTFVYGFDLIGIEPSGGVAFSFLFFAITAFSSLCGAFFIHQPLGNTKDS